MNDHFKNAVGCVVKNDNEVKDITNRDAKNGIVDNAVNRAANDITNRDAKNGIVDNADPNANDVIINGDPNANYVIINADQNANDVIINADRNANDVIINADRNANDVIINADPNANDVIINADPNANDVIINADPNANDVIINADPNANDVIINADPIANDVVINADPNADDIIINGDPNANDANDGVTVKAKLNLSPLHLPPKIKVRGRPKGAGLTVIGLPRKKNIGNGPVKFMMKPLEEKELQILGWILPDNVVKQALHGKIVEVEEIPIDASELLPTLLDENVNWKLVEKYFTECLVKSELFNRTVTGGP